MGVTASIVSSVAAIGSTAYAIGQKPKTPKDIKSVPDMPEAPKSDETLLNEQRKRRAALSGDSMGGTILTGPKGISPVANGSVGGPNVPGLADNSKKTLLGV